MALSLSIRGKCILLACGSAAVALVLTCAGLAVNGVQTLKVAKLRQLSDQVKMVAFHASPVLTLNSREAGERLLASLQDDATVEAASIVDANFREVASYGAAVDQEDVKHRAKTGSQFVSSNRFEVVFPKHVEVIQPVIVGVSTLGHIFVRANTKDMRSQMLDFARIAGYVLGAAMSVAFLLSILLQRGISRPIAGLTRAAHQIAVAGDYSIRVELSGGAELQMLQTAFNRMLDQIQSSDEALQRAHNELEERVHERTEELSLEIGRRKVTQSDLKRAKDAAEAANRAKSDFLANVSHEIRTPLNSIIGFADLMLRDSNLNMPPEQRESLEAIQRGGMHLTDLIDDVLDLSKIEAGRLEVERIGFSPHDVISEVVTVLRMRAHEKGLSLNYEWSSPLPERIESDPARMRQLLMNLIGNAIKFTEQGGIRVIASTTASLDPRLQVEVVDTGIGIPESKLDSIFEPFTQADTSVTRRFGGTGLGLAISRKVATALGGDLTVASRVREGSRFTVTLITGSLRGVPMLSSPPVTAPIAASPKTRVVTLPPARLLVVDDGETNRKLVRLILQRAGAKIKTVENGKQAIEAVEGDTFDAILMDMQMPVLDGYSATRMLRSRGCQLPIIALTAHAMKGDEEKCRQAGCSGYMTKPIDSDRLLATLAPFLANVPAAEAPPAPAPEQLPRQSVATTVSVTPCPSVPTGGPIYSNLPMDDREFREIVEEFIDRARDKVADIRRAWTNRDSEELRQQAHWLKGAGGSAGFPIYTEHAKHIETLAREQRLEEVEPSLQEIEGITQKIAVPPLPSEVGG